MKKNTQKLKTKFGLKTKMLATLLPCIAVVIVVCLIVSHSTSADVAKLFAKKYITTETKERCEILSKDVTSILTSLNETKNTLEFLEGNETLISKYLNTTVKKSSYFPEGVFLGDDSRRYEPWYQEGLLHNKFAFGSTRRDSKTNAYVVSATSKIESKNGKELVAAANIDLRSFSQKIAQMQLMDTGYYMLIDSNTFSILGHKNTEHLGNLLTSYEETSLYRQLEDLVAAKTYSITSIYEGSTEYYINIQPVDNTSWVVLSCVPVKEVLNEVFKLLSLTYILAIASLIIITIVIVLLANFIVRPIKKVTHAINETTHGNFTINVDVKGNDETTIMSRDLNTFIQTMQTMIGDINQISNRLGGQSENCNTISEQLYDSASNQSNAMQQLTLTVEEMANSVNEVAINANDLAKIVSSTSEKGSLTNQQMKDTMLLTEESNNKMIQIKESMKRIETSISALSRTVNDVGSSTQEIVSFVQIIGDIAEQTNLLSLNAAIEAARAGDAGKGFAVVAEEIGKLAETCSNAVKQISSLTTSISGLIANTVGQTKISVDDINVSSSLIIDASDNFHTIFDTIQKSGSLMNDMMKDIHSVEEIATSLAAITEEQSASTEEILATSVNIANLTEEVTSNSEAVAANSTELDSTSKVLKDHMSKFTI